MTVKALKFTPPATLKRVFGLVHYYCTQGGSKNHSLQFLHFLIYFLKQRNKAVFPNVQCLNDWQRTIMKFFQNIKKNLLSKITTFPLLNFFDSAKYFIQKRWLQMNF